VFTRIAPVILWLTFANGEVLGTTPGHTIWTDDRGWVFAEQLDEGDSVLTADGASTVVKAAELDTTPTQTYNFAVYDTATYFANGIWVHNSSCKLPRHGSDLHWAKGQQRYDELLEGGARNLEWNKALRNSKGEIISRSRPDLQYIGADGKVHIEEVIVTHQQPGREAMFQQLLGADFGTYKEIAP